MNSPSPETQRQMAAAAEFRAGGVCWESVARKLRCSERDCRSWIEDFPKLWAKLLRQAEKRQEREARAEARVILREMLRGVDEKTKLAAAQQLLKVPPRAKPVRGRNKLSDEDEELAAYIRLVQGMTDDELHERTTALAETDRGCDPPSAAVAE